MRKNTREWFQPAALLSNRPTMTSRGFLLNPWEEYFVISRIDPSLCIGCGQCFKTCSLDVFRLDTRQPTRSPCAKACPAGTDMRAYNHLVQQGRLTEALDTLKQAMPFPAITGRVCFHPCENECTRAHVDAAVNINALEQFLGDLDLTRLPEPASVRRSASVAVVGSGPAGLSAAWFLARAGYPVTVFEALPEPGGMLRYGIPAYRLPDAVVAGQIRILEHVGVRFRCGIRIGDGGDLGLEDLERSGFRAVVLAPGLSVGKRLPLEGADLPGVWTGVEFLRALRCGERPALGRRTVVVGGGNVAIDAAISARRLGVPQVDLYCLEDAEHMPAFAHNVEDARAEGVRLHPAFGPQRLAALSRPDGSRAVAGVEFAPCLRLFDEQGAWSPRFDTERPVTADADAVVLAIGQSGDLEPFRRHAALDRGRIVADPLSLAVSHPGVFAAGDAVSGPASVIEAVAGGRRAARGVMRLLQGRVQPSAPSEESPVADMPQDALDRLPRIPRRERAVADAPGFAESRVGFDAVRAQAESMRCLTCGSRALIAYDDDCMTCFHCELRCPAGAVDVHPFKERLPYTLYDNAGGHP